ncbi:ABC transporter permease [Clostridium sp. 'deep sea']|uniref:ABC transporter permease n=1 Tax=Clostridium sp. 'deep sea' TaxID=2779445 RepID=UPI001896578F|nr:ABC transporter permease [Clostridium sp. 'deep sea']QOR35420.1 ABC transporter permease [Clostridium sp. 'deep sea']
MKELRKLALPYKWVMILLVVIPILIMIFLSFTNTQGIDLANAKLSLNNFKKLGESIYLDAVINSVVLSSIATLICLLIGYPMAYIIANLKSKKKWLVLILLICPMWSNMLLRVIAWEQLFKPNSLLNIIGISLNLLGTKTAIVIGMVSIYLPFMIFPIYTSLEKMDKSLLEASRDLGASPVQVFTKIIFPLSLGGVASGVLMTLLPSATAFALPQRLGGGNILLIGNVIENMFKKVFNYNLGSLLSLFVITIIFASIGLFNKGDEDGGMLV